MIYWDLLIGFLKVGCFSFGGAYSAIPLIRDVVLSYGWIDDEFLTYMIAVAESTPGPIMVNLATYIGTTQGGVFGAILATFAVVLPAFVIIILVTAVLKKFIQNNYVQAFLNGIKPCVIGVILATGLYMIAKNIFGTKFNKIDDKAIIVTAFLFVIYFAYKKLKKKNISPILLIAISSLLGIVVYGV